MYNEKNDIYFKNIRVELLDLIPQENRNGTVLEIGAGSGENLIYAKKHGYADKIYGVELMKIPNESQEDDKYEEFIIGNIETMPLNYEENQFDVIIMGDVIEHLVDPYSTVRKLKKFLKPDGVLISSIPNVRNLKTFRNLFLRGTFRYYDHGIFDRTHLRFFAKKDIMKLFTDVGYNIDKIMSELKYNVKSLEARRNRMTFGLFEEFLTPQYFTVARCVK